MANIKKGNEYIVDEENNIAKIKVERKTGEILYIAFNPHYIVDVFNIIDCDNPVCRGRDNKCPMFIDGNEYNFIILPVNIGNGDVMEKIRGHINRAA